MNLQFYIDMQQYIERDIEKIIYQPENQSPVIAIHGARQSGKTTLVRTLFSKDYKYINFDDMITRERALKDPSLFFSQLPEKVIFDEIQQAAELLPYLKTEVDKFPSFHGRFIITSSIKFEKIKNIELLSGQATILELQPFNINELQKTGLFKRNFNLPQRIYEFSALSGCIPEIALNPEQDLNQWYNNYLQSCLEKDVRSHYKISNLYDFTLFLRHLAGYCARPLNLTDLAKDIGKSVNTVKNWLAIVESTHLVYLLRPYFKDDGKRIVKSPKLYWTDMGMVSYLTGTNTKEALYYGSMSGAFFKNFVFQEILKSFTNKGIIPPLYYLKTSNDLEMDVLIDKGGSIIPVDIRPTKSPEIHMVRNIQNFKELFHNWNIEKGYLITLYEETMQVAKNVTALKIEDISTVF
jgi:uncharacterized protein